MNPWTGKRCLAWRLLRAGHWLSLIHIYVIVPEEGSYLGINQVNITKSCQNTDLAYKFISWLISYDVQYQDAIDRVEAPANMKVELTEEQAAGMCYGDAVSVSSAPNWELYSEKNDAWILRYNEEIYQ